MKCGGWAERWFHSHGLSNGWAGWYPVPLCFALLNNPTQMGLWPYQNHQELLALPLSRWRMLGPMFSWCQPTTAWATKSKTCHLQSRDRFELICNRLEKDQPLHSSLQKTRLKPCIAWRTLVWANASITSQLHDRNDGHFGDYAGDGHDGETFQDFHSWQNFVPQQDT